MRSAVTFATSLTLFGCTVQPPAPCPDGAEQVEQAGEKGLKETWCQQLDGAGNWVRHGPSVAHHPNGQFAARGDFANDRREGVWRYWFDNGKLRETGRYHD